MFQDSRRILSGPIAFPHFTWPISVSSSRVVNEDDTIVLLEGVDQSCLISCFTVLVASRFVTLFQTIKTFLLKTDYQTFLKIKGYFKVFPIIK